MPRDSEPSQPLGPDLLAGFGDAVATFLDTQAPLVAEVGATPMLDLAEASTAGGKRFRPAFCFWGYVAAAGIPDDPGPLLRASASLDLLHVSALVHDDIIDASDTRRGRPAAHRQFEALHAERDGRGNGARFGEGAAILLGDLLLMWSIEMFDHCGLPADALARARPILAAMRTEVTCGQYLDLSAAHGVAGARDEAGELEVAHRVLEFKSARYSIRRPAQVGAALAGADERLDAALAGFGSLVGRAFQLRDDLLGVFGDPAHTGKPSGDDLTEGKRTVLVLEALHRASRSQRTALEDVLGRRDPTADQLARARAVIEATGAARTVEELIDSDTRRALDILDAADLTPEGRTALVRLAELSVKRDR